MQRFCFKKYKTFKKSENVKYFVFIFLFLTGFAFLSFSVFSGGGSSSTFNNSFLRDQFSIRNPKLPPYVINGNYIQDSTLGFNLGGCESGASFSVCGSNAKSASCCLGSSNYGYVSWVSYGGKDSIGHRLFICFGYPDPTLNTVSYRCEVIHPSDGTRNISLSVGMNVSINARLMNVDFINPGFDPNDFDTTNSGCGCKDTSGNVVHCAGYTLLEEALNGCLNVDTTYNSQCTDGKECPCDVNCIANGFVPKGLFGLSLQQQTCYLCNKIGRAALNNCIKIKQCFDNGALNTLKNKLNNSSSNSGYGNGLYICGYSNGKRVGCTKASGVGGPRHFPRTIFCPGVNTSNSTGVDLTLCPGYNLLENLPIIRPFRDLPTSGNQKYCIPALSSELGYKIRGTFFRPKAHIQYDATDIEVKFIPDYLTSVDSSIYDLDGLDSTSLDTSVTDILSATRFSSRLYRARSSSYTKNNTGTCNIVYGHQYYDIAIRLEYNKRTNESQLVGYILEQTQNDVNTIVDGFTGELSQYSDVLNASDFIDGNVRIVDMDGSLIPFNFGQKYYIQRIGSIPRPPLRHYYIGQSILFPLSIEPDTLATGTINLQYVNPYRINIIPANSVNPSERNTDPDYYLPQDSVSIYVAKPEQLSSAGAGDLSSFNCGFLYGSYFCAKIDYCSIISTFQTTDFLINPPNSYYCDGLTNQTKQYECYMANILVPICNNRVFCDQTENKTQCQDRVGIKLYESDSLKYKINKNFQDQSLTCIMGNLNYDHLSAISDITRYGPFGDPVYDMVISFNRPGNSIAQTLPLTTRPATNYSPYTNERFTNADIYRMTRSDFTNATPNNIVGNAVNDLITNSTWVMNFLGCSNSTCLASNINVRSIDVDELPMGTMCTSLIYNAQTSIEFTESRQRQYHDYDLYIPLRCQYLTTQLVGAGGAGSSEEQNVFIQAGAYADAELPAISASGCSGGYLQGNIKTDDGVYSKDYLGIQVGERTKYCKTWLDQGCARLSGGANNTLSHPGNMGGGCHNYDGNAWRGDSSVSLFSSSLMTDAVEVGKATKGRSQIDLINASGCNGNVHRIGLGVTGRDGGCIAGFVVGAAALIGAATSICANPLTAYLCPAAMPAAIIQATNLLNLIPVVCLTYGITSKQHPTGNISVLDQYYSSVDICPGEYGSNNNYFSNVLSYSGSDANMSSGEKRLVGGGAFESFVFGANGSANLNINQTPQMMSDLKSAGASGSTMSSSGGYFNIDNPNVGSGGAFNAGNTSNNFSTKPPQNTQPDIKIIFDAGPVPNYTVYSCSVTDVNNNNTNSFIVKSEIFSCNSLVTAGMVGNYKCKIVDRSGIVTNINLSSPIYCQDPTICSCIAYDSSGNILTPAVTSNSCSTSLCGLNGSFCIPGDDCKSLCPKPPSSIQVEGYTGGITNSCQCPNPFNPGNRIACSSLYSSSYYSSCFECVYTNPNFPTTIDSSGNVSIDSNAQNDYNNFVINGLKAMPISTNQVSYQTGAPDNASQVNQTPPNPGSSNSNSYKEDKYSGAGGSGKVIVSVPLVKHININKPNMHPYFDNGKKVIGTGSNYLPDMDCKFRCPKVNVLFHIIQINLPDYTGAGDLLCEYSAFGDTDMEVPSYMSVVYPMKCYIISNNSGDKQLQAFHGSVVFGDICPVAKCTNGMIKDDNRLYGMCQYASGDSSNVFYHKAIQSSGNISTNGSINGSTFSTTMYGQNNSIQLASCVNTNIDQLIISDSTLQNDLLAMKCVNGFWEYQMQKVLVNSRANLFSIPYTRNDNNSVKDIGWGTSQKDQARTTDLNVKEPLSYYQEISLFNGSNTTYSRRALTSIKLNLNNSFTVKNNVKCPPLINAIDYDSDYTGNAVWEMTDENTTAYAVQCRSGFKLNNMQLPTRKCRTNGIWGPIQNPCK